MTTPWEQPVPNMAQTWGQLLEAFSGDQTPRTGKTYVISIRQFYESCLKAPQDVTMLDVVHWRDHLQRTAPAIRPGQSGRSAATVRARIAALSSWYRWLQEHPNDTGDSIVGRNPARVKCAKVVLYSRSRKMDVEQWKAVLAAIDTRKPAGRRDKAWLTFYVYTARRLTEVASLQWEALSEAKGKVSYTYRGKGGKEKTRELPGPVVAALTEWRPEWQNLTGAMWPRSASTIRRRFQAYAVEAGFDATKFTIHSLRHLGALLRKLATKGDLQKVQAHLDHQSIATTQVYLERLEEAEDTDADAVEDLLR